MSGPAFQLTGTRFTPASAFGISEFGTSPFGGSAQVVYEIPPYHLGSDDLTETYRRQMAEIVHERLGIPVSVRPWTKIKRWAVNFNSVDESELDELQTYFEARVFRFLPDSGVKAYYTVRWVDVEFRPSYIKPGKYSLSFEIEEVLS